MFPYPIKTTIIPAVKSHIGGVANIDWADPKPPDPELSVLSVCFLILWKSTK